MYYGRFFIQVVSHRVFSLGCYFTEIQQHWITYEHCYVLIISGSPVITLTKDVH